MPYLAFKGKSSIDTYHHTIPHHSFEFVQELSVLNDEEQASLSGNLIIEGDNLLALKSLLPTHAGKIKCIYIDPPYNTGEEKWVYNDNLTQPQFKEWIGETVGKEGEDATRHDKWCCMMYPRLQLLRDLLHPEGVLFVSIDENEAGNLRLMLDEVFSADKPLATFVWKKRSPTGMRQDPVSVDHEYILVYAKDSKRVKLHGLLRRIEDYPLVDGSNGKRYASTDLTIGMTCDDRPNQCYPIENPRTHVTYEPNPNRAWRFEPDTMRKIIADNLVIWPDESDGQMTRPRYKTYYDPEKPKIKPVSSWIEGASRKQAEIQAEEEELDVAIIASGLNAEGGRDLQRILGQKLFNYPKPPSLITSLVRIATRNDDIVLDSFAGSGTTAQAVLELNAEDDGHRRFILAQVRHETKDQERDGFNVCTEVTRERIRRIAQGYTYRNQKGKEIEVDGIGGSFTYARVSEEPLFGAYRDLGEHHPAYDDIAKYIFYTETNQNWDPVQMNRQTGLIGEFAGTSYYLLYEPSTSADSALDANFLRNVGAEDANSRLVVYCEKLWLHRDELRRWEPQAKKTVRTMHVPFNLK